MGIGCERKERDGGNRYLSLRLVWEAQRVHLHPTHLLHWVCGLDFLVLQAPYDCLTSLSQCFGRGRNHLVSLVYASASCAQPLSGQIPSPPRCGGHLLARPSLWVCEVDRSFLAPCGCLVSLPRWLVEIDSLRDLAADRWVVYLISVSGPGLDPEKVVACFVERAKFHRRRG